MADKSFTNGEYIFREGESAAYAYVIKSGTVEITKHSTAGEQVLAELAAPTIFGEMALIQKRDYCLNVIDCKLKPCIINCFG